MVDQGHIVLFSKDQSFADHPKSKETSEFTRRNFILDERVTGKVTLMTPTKISPEEAYQVFLSALEIKGFTAVEDGRIIRIEYESWMFCGRSCC